MTEVKWERYPTVAQSASGRTWLTIQAKLGLAANTIDAYGRALEEYHRFSHRRGVAVEYAAREHIANYVHDMATRPGHKGARGTSLDARPGLANATLQQRLTALRLFYDYLLEEEVRSDNPVGRGRYTPGKHFGGARARGLIPRYVKLPWIPNDEEWQRFLAAARQEPQRNRAMLALAYDSALRREELCRLETGDIDPSAHVVRVRAEVTKGRRERIVPFSLPTAELYARYLRERGTISRARGPLFLSLSRRNYAQPLSIWTWSKVVRGLAVRAELPRFCTHTPRHLCLTDLARAGWDLHEIAAFAGHRNVQTTLLYIHLSGRELATKVQRGMAQVHAWRAQTLAAALR